MFKRLLIFIFTLCLLVLIWQQSQQLILSFFVLFPLLLFPLFFHWRRKDLVYFLLSAIFTLILFAVQATQFPAIEMGLLGLGFLAFLGVLSLYQRQWMLARDFELRKCKEASSELKNLEEKHESRSESLRHLERQVAGLMNLYEIAKDFGECLSLRCIADIMSEKILPEMPCERMVLALHPKQSDLQMIPYEFVITANQVEEKEGGANPRRIDCAHPGLKLKSNDPSRQAMDFSASHKWFSF